jgi:pectate disaccharide-lyase
MRVSEVRRARQRQTSRRLLQGMLGLLIVLAVGSFCRAGSTGMAYYVATNGSDANDGTREHPFATIRQAAQVVNPGDTVIVRDGVYSDLDKDKAVVPVRRSGSPGAPITFRAEHKWKAVIDGQHNQGMTAWSLWHATRLSYVTIEDFEVKDFAHSAFSIFNTDHVLIRGNHVHHIGNVETTTTNGLDGSYDSPECSYITYDGNVIHDIGRIGPPTVNFNLDHGIYTCGKHNVITNNLFYNNDAGWGVQVAGYRTVDDLVICNNTFAWGKSRGHIVIWDGSPDQPEGQLGVRNLLIQNNIFYQPLKRLAAINVSAEKPEHFSNIVLRHNLLYGGTGELYDTDRPGSAAVTASDTLLGRDPRFVDPQGHDFHLRPDSPAIGAGIADRAPRTDIDGHPRPDGKGLDLGAYQR